MAGIAIGDVENILENIAGTEKIPVSSGQNTPQVVTTQELKEYIQEGMPLDALTNMEIEQLLNNSEI